jgi:GT2 family glycosyltransferase
MESKDLTIVIVTFKSEKKIINCLRSISNEIPVIVVENSNDKNFKENIENNFKNVNCVLAGSNKGYAVANNIGLGLVKSKYALVLNPDTTLTKDSIKNFFIFTKKIEDFWLIGPGNDQGLNLNFEQSNFKEVNNLKGFAIFFNMSKFNQKYFDNNFFLFFEEIDLCKRVKNNKGKIILVKNIVIKHEGASSVDLNNDFELEKNRNWHWMWSTFYYQKKYKGTFLAIILIFPKLFSAIFKTLFYLLIFNKKKRDIYFYRLSGIIYSMIGKKSWYRPSLD